MVFVIDHGEHLGQDVVAALDAGADPGVVCAGVNLVDAKAVVDGESELRCKVLAVAR